MTSCPPIDLIQASRAGTLPAHLQERIQAHVAQCAICAALGEALEDESISNPTREERERIELRLRAGISRDTQEALQRRRWRWSAAAAVLAIATVGALMVWPIDDGLSASRPSVFGIDKEELLSLVPSGQPRFGPADAGERADLAEALAPYASGDFDEAARRLRALVNVRPTSGPAHFYLGVTRMHAGRDLRAAPSLEFAQRAARVEAPHFLHSANWYLAMVFVRVGQLDRARPMLKALCDSQGDTAGRACEGLQELRTSIRFSGIVSGPDGEPLAGVTVGQHLLRSEDIYLVTEPTRLTTTTDRSGRYAVVGLPLSLASSAIIRAAKPGYFTRTAGVPILRESQADFRLARWVQIPVGTVVRGTVTPDEMPSGNPRERCDEYALTVPANGTIEVSVDAPDREMMDLYVETPAGDVYGPQDGDRMRLVLPAGAGSTFQIRILNFSEQPQPYALTTRLR